VVGRALGHFRPPLPACPSSVDRDGATSVATAAQSVDVRLRPLRPACRLACGDGRPRTWADEGDPAWQCGGQGFESPQLHPCERGGHTGRPAQTGPCTSWRSCSWHTPPSTSTPAWPDRNRASSLRQPTSGRLPLGVFLWFAARFANRSRVHPRPGSCSTARSPSSRKRHYLVPLEDPDTVARLVRDFWATQNAATAS
jgi:hypothetical protein